MATTSLSITNSTLSKLIGKTSHGNHKRTQQGVPNALLPYLYNRYIVCANNKYTYPNIHVLFMSSPHCSHKANIFSNIIVLDPSTTFQTYDLISCDTSCDHSHMPLHCPRELKEKKKKKENRKQKIKEREY